MAYKGKHVKAKSFSDYKGKCIIAILSICAIAILIPGLSFAVEAIQDLDNSPEHQQAKDNKIFEQNKSVDNLSAPNFNPEKCMSFTPTVGSAKFKVLKKGSGIDFNPNLEYSTNEGTTWLPITFDQDFVLDKKIYIKGNNPDGLNNADSYITFDSVDSDCINVGGNVMSLLDNGMGTTQTIPCPYCFQQMFFGFFAMKNTPEVPAINLTEYCYSGMFYGCEYITEFPVLPAQKLKEGCYDTMFGLCDNVVEGYDSLPILELAPRCYRAMFSSCSKLKKAPNLPATSLQPYCYISMFQNCEALESAPELMAEELAEGCYEMMFFHCTGLKNVSINFTNWLGGTATNEWLTNTTAGNITINCPAELEVIYGDKYFPTSATIKKNIKLNSHVVEPVDKVFVYDGSVKSINVGVFGVSKDYTSLVNVEGTLSATDPGTYTFKVTPKQNASNDGSIEYVMSGEYIGTWTILPAGGTVNNIVINSIEQSTTPTEAATQENKEEVKLAESHSEQEGGSIPVPVAVGLGAAGCGAAAGLALFLRKKFF